METKLDNNKRNPFARKLSFPLGEVRITDGAERKLDPYDVVTGITRHARGDWGDLDDHDWQQNDNAYEHGGRLFSRFIAKCGKAFWVITECDRSATTVLLPEEY
ncbi:MAG: hypothetical protein IPJ77_24925 [Planctomycetes bacterium]|jgi:hypothetical protein|nr:hypothetical protein [Planctomycetota bacterium]MCK6570118.1 hypothetical protein [Myxococcota bacterium]